MPEVVIRFNFDQYQEDDYTGYNLASIEQLSTDIPDSGLRGIVESLAQSDKYWTKDAWDILDALESRS